MPTLTTNRLDSAWATPGSNANRTIQAITKAATTIGAPLPPGLQVTLGLDLPRLYPSETRAARTAAAEALADAAMIPDERARAKAVRAVLDDRARAQAEQDAYDDAVTALLVRKARAARDALPEIRESFADALADDFEVLNECLPLVPDPLPQIDRVSPAAFEAYTKVRPARARVEAALAGLAAISPVWVPDETRDTDGARFTAWSKLLVVIPTDETKFGPLASALYGHRAVAVQTAGGPQVRTTEGDWLRLVLDAGARLGISTDDEQYAAVAAAEAERIIAVRSGAGVTADTPIVRY